MNAGNAGTGRWIKNNKVTSAERCGYKSMSQYETRKSWIPPCLRAGRERRKSGKKKQGSLHNLQQRI